jgi:uncharacterized surface protein with fasciclin (FAS1) repeats
MPNPKLHRSRRCWESAHGAITGLHKNLTGPAKIPRLSARNPIVKRISRLFLQIRIGPAAVTAFDAQARAQNREEDMQMLRRTFLSITAATMLSAPAFAGSHTMDIVDTAVGAGSFTTLVAAVQAAGLVETLKGEGPFTVFAPTDEAFAALPAGTVEELLKPENKDKLTAILTFHVVPGKVMSTDLSNDMKAATVEGEEVTIMTEGGVKVNGANVVQADIEASNGVIHVIDAVILPASAM